MYVDEKSKFAGVEVKHDPFSLEALIAWLKSQDAEEHYNYGCHGYCLIARHFIAHGVPFSKIYSFGDYDDLNGIGRRYPRAWDNIASKSPHTFGAALSRAEALLSSSTPSQKE